MSSLCFIDNALCPQMRYEDIYDGLEVYSKPATVESELYTQLKAFSILNILHSQIRFVNVFFSLQQRCTWQLHYSYLALLGQSKQSACKKIRTIVKYCSNHFYFLVQPVSHVPFV